MRFSGSPGPSDFFSQIRHRNALTEIAWEDAEQGPGLAMSTMLPWQLFIARCFTNGDISGCVFSLVFQGDDLLKIANVAKSQILLRKKLVPRESGGNGV